MLNSCRSQHFSFCVISSPAQRMARALYKSCRAGQDDPPFYFNDMTEKEKHRFYHSAAWQRERIRILKRDHYECQDCRHRITKANHEGRQLHGWEMYLNRATCVHHIKELEDYPDLALDHDNLISLCDRCHNERHGRTTNRFFTRAKKKKPITPEMW